MKFKKLLLTVCAALTNNAAHICFAAEEPPRKKIKISHESFPQTIIISDMTRSIIENAYNGFDAQNLLAQAHANKTYKKAMEEYVEKNIQHILELLTNKTGNIFRSLDILFTVDLISIEIYTSLFAQLYTQYPGIFFRYNLDQEMFLNAVSSGNQQRVRDYINNGGNLNIYNQESGWGALSNAIVSGKSDILRILLQYPTLDINVILPGMLASPIAEAIIANNQEAVALILERADLDINKLNRLGETPLDVAIRRKRSSQMISMLRKRGAKTADELKQEQFEQQVIQEKKLPPLQ